MIRGEHTYTHPPSHARTHTPQKRTEPFSLNGQSSQEWKRGSGWKKTGNRGDWRRKEKPRGQRSFVEEQAESDSLIVEELSRGLCVSVGLVVESGNLHAPFPLHALQVVGCVDCTRTLAASGCSLCFCILSCVVFLDFFHTGRPDWVLPAEWVYTVRCLCRRVSCLLMSVFLSLRLSHLDLPRKRALPLQAVLCRTKF